MEPIWKVRLTSRMPARLSDARPRDECRLLFVGVDWRQKEERMRLLSHNVLTNTVYRRR